MPNQQGIARAAEEIGIHAVEVVAINDAVRRFYLKYGLHR
jgi:hypothetical protein